MRPSKPFFHCSLLMELDWPLIAQLPYKVFECYMFFNCWHVIVSTWLAVAVPGFALVKWIPELLLTEAEILSQATPGSKRHKTTASIREMATSMEVYQHLFMLCNRLIAVTRTWLVGISYFTGKLVGIYMGYASLKLALDDSIPWKEYIAYPTSCLFILLFFGFASPEAEQLHTNATDFIHQLKCKPSNKQLRKTIRHTRPMAIWVIDIMYFRKGTGIEVVNDVIEEIADLIVGSNEID